MIYRVIGVMSGSSLDGLDIAFVEFSENAGKWTYEIKYASCYPYSQYWTEKLQTAPKTSAKDYQLLHAAYGHYIGQEVNKFIAENNLHYQVALVASHGHTSFHIPSKRMTAQLGDGAAIAAATHLPVVTDLRALDIAFGGQGAPIVPIGEKLLLGDYDLFLNLGGIANISFNSDPYIAFDVCPANRVLNLLANDVGKEYDHGGELAAAGAINGELLDKLNDLGYYKQSYPKSLANDFGTHVIYPMILSSKIESKDALRTYVEHIAMQMGKSLVLLPLTSDHSRMLVTGGGAFNHFLIQRLKQEFSKSRVELILPDDYLVKYKEAMIMAFVGVLRWRQEYNVLRSVTGATRNSIGGALWTGQEA